MRITSTSVPRPAHAHLARDAGDTASLTLAACGGGGGDRRHSTSTSPPQTIPPLAASNVAPVAAPALRSPWSC
jgi:hypothetical protein